MNIQSCQGNHTVFLVILKDLDGLLRSSCSLFFSSFFFSEELSGTRNRRGCAECDELDVLLKLIKIYN